jgi:predicted DNA-binding protein|tara:strand:- start:394 stop:552 length:159 start_codon:yes stop_codon:yes gene_type:complete
MPTITISLPNELKERLDKHKDINWSEVFRRAFEKKVKELEEFELFKAQRGES